MDIHVNKVRVGRGLLSFVVLVIVIAGSVSCQKDKRQNTVRAGSDSAGNGILVFSTYVGGSNGDSIRDVAIDNDV